jgi:hypothetical protein
VDWPALTQRWQARNELSRCRTMKSPRPSGTSTGRPTTARRALVPRRWRHYPRSAVGCKGHGQPSFSPDRTSIAHGCRPCWREERPKFADGPSGSLQAPEFFEQIMSSRKLPNPAERAHYAEPASGSVILKQLGVSSLASATASPPCSRAIWRTSDRPSPAPFGSPVRR